MAWMAWIPWKGPVVSGLTAWIFGVQAKKADEVATKDSMQRASVEREKAWVLVGFEAAEAVASPCQNARNTRFMWMK